VALDCQMSAPSIGDSDLDLSAEWLYIACRGIPYQHVKFCICMRSARANSYLGIVP
jgi:hypothetical protein